MNIIRQSRSLNILPKFTKYNYSLLFIIKKGKSVIFLPFTRALASCLGVQKIYLRYSEVLFQITIQITKIYVPRPLAHKRSRKMRTRCHCCYYLVSKVNEEMDLTKRCSISINRPCPTIAFLIGFKLAMSFGHRISCWSCNRSYVHLQEEGVTCHLARDTMTLLSD